MSVFYNRFLGLCNGANKSPSSVALDVGTSKTSVTRWKCGALPPDAMILKLAEYFDVSFSWLKGETDEKTPAPKGSEREVLMAAVENMNRDELLDFIARATEILRDK